MVRRPWPPRNCRHRTRAVDRYRAELDDLLTAIALPDKSGEIPKASDLIMATLDGIWLDWMRRRNQLSTQNALLACMDHARMSLT